ncbi:hypothetical protein COV19_02740 [Candidatus Woesearchaeota archaeon CG10_big_fil_rev_8_21_14_0_10_44_13]|nr:MAG: hypothetical protein COV19_02740 [Candidatus Woesearchaeota archaeon CG10_big_fil_rev_8_21_14_0_10_44_13]
MSITKEVENYIMQNRTVRAGLKQGIINYSSLSRRLIKEIGLKKKDFDAVLIACRRLERKLKADISTERKIEEILSNSKLEIKTGIVVFIIEKGTYFDYLLDIEKKVKKQKQVFQVIEGTGTITIITTNDFSEELRGLFKNDLIRENKGLAEITIKTSNAIERTPGVLSYLYSLFGDHSINIFETMSTWTDTLFVIDENDLEKAVRILRFR